MIALVVTVREDDSGEVQRSAFLKSPVRIGRGELNDLTLGAPFVSTYHGVLQFDDREARYVDLGSLNGSLLDGEAIEKNVAAVLVPGCEVRIGTFALTFERSDVREERALSRRTTFAAIAEVVERARPTGPPKELAPAAGQHEDPAILASEAVASATVELDIDYMSYRGAWEHLRAGLERTTAGLEDAARRVALERLAIRYPSLVSEPQFLAMLGQGFDGAAGARPPAPASSRPPTSGSNPPGVDAARLLRTFCESYLPVVPDLSTAAEIESVLGRIAACLEAFATSFIELRQGHEEFGRQMGVSTVAGEGAFHDAADVHRLLAYVLDPTVEGREADLQRAFAEFMVHQVALLRGVVEGARAMLGELAPEAIEARARQSVWKTRGTALWEAYRERFHEIADEDGTISAVLFGREFARAYAAMVGHRPPDDRSPSSVRDDEPSPEPEPEPG